MIVNVKALTARTVRARALSILSALFLWVPHAFPAAESTARPAAVAGRFYPGQRDALVRQVDRHLALSPVLAAERPLALIVPHAGYIYSAGCAARAFRLIKGRKYKRVILLGPSHYGAFRGAALPTHKSLSTPLGQVAVDEQAVAALRRQAGFLVDPQSDRREHALEVQLPFLKRLLPSFLCLPIRLGRLEKDDVAGIAKALLPFAGEDTLVVVSSDFTHFGGHFQYTPFKTNIAHRIRALDGQAIRYILEKDAGAFLNHVSQTGATICGRNAIAVLLEMLKQGPRPGNSRGLWLSFHTSADIMGVRSDRLLLQYGSVSYGSLAFFPSSSSQSQKRQSQKDLSMKPADLLPPSHSFDAETQKQLLALARTTLQTRLVEKKQGDPKKHTAPDRIPPASRYKAGAFVTLHKHGRLRGCIGAIEPTQPLWEAIVGNAINAACHDPRFNPVTASELAELDIEISVLTPPREVPRAEDFQVGTHGIIIEKNGRRAVFLPQVAPEQGWDREETLAHLSRKAGLSADDWRSGMRFWVFEAQVFGEKE